MKTLIVLKISFGLTILTALQFCDLFETSKNEILFEECTFSNTHKAVLFIKPGNATTDNSIHLSIIDCEENLKDSQTGSVFVANSDHGNTKIDSDCVTFKWQSEDTLIVYYDSTLRIFNQQTFMKDLVVFYEKR